MKKLTKLQYEVIFLYSKGLKFKEIDTALTTASRGVYSQVLAKDRSRITRAKLSRETNLNSYKIILDKKIDEVRKQYKHLKKYHNFVKEDYLTLKDKIKVICRIDYINFSLDRANKSYSKYKLTFLKNHLENSHKSEQIRE